MNIAQQVRLSKEKHPQFYCGNSRCLWRTGGGNCPRHGGPPRCKGFAKCNVAGCGKHGTPDVG